MGTIVVQVKSTQAAHQLADFLKTIEYVDNVEHQENNSPHTEKSPSISITKGNYTPTEKPSDFAGIWKNPRKVDARKLRKKAWQRKK
jgi:hypothetical protein